MYGDCDNSISFEDNSTATFSNNKAEQGGAIYSCSGNMSFTDNSTTVFRNNIARVTGGAIFVINYFSLINKEEHNDLYGNIFFKGNSITVFSNNTGRTIYSYDGILYFEDDSTTVFKVNERGAIHIQSTLKIVASGNFHVMFSDQPVKWCANACLSYTGQSNVTIDSTGIVWCSDQRAFICKGRNCYCKNLGHMVENATNNILANVSYKAVLSSVIKLEVIQNISILGNNDLTVICVDGGRLQIESCSNLIIEGVSWIGCGVLAINHSGDVIVQHCSFQHSVGQAMRLSGVLGDVTISHCKFMNNNHYSDHGIALYYSSNNPANVLTIDNCDFSFNRHSKSVVYIRQSLIHFNNSIFHNNQGVSIYLSKYDSLYIHGEMISENNVAENGAGIYVIDHSTVTFGASSKVKFIKNVAQLSGAVLFLNNHSSVLFNINSIVLFSNNKAINGIVYSEVSSNVTFNVTCKVTFRNNAVTLYGAAIHSLDNSCVTFTGNSNVTFSNNIIHAANNRDIQIGGTIFSQMHSHVSFKGDSTAVFSNNVADVGAAIFSYYNSSVTFKGMSNIVLHNNTVRYCGIVMSSLFTSISFNDNVTVTYSANKMECTMKMNEWLLQTFC